jgi:hypothetical protein
MPDSLLNVLLKAVQDQGFSTLLFIVAIWYLQKQIDRLSVKVVECESDRKTLWERMISSNHKNHD